MNVFLNYAGQRFSSFHLLVMIVVFLCVVASIFYRINKQKSIFAKTPQNALFKERWSSAGMVGGGGAKNCLMVAISKEALVIAPQFPFSLMFVPEIFGLDQVVEKTAVRAIHREKGLFYTTFFIDFEPSPGIVKVLRVRPRNPSEFERIFRRWQMTAAHNRQSAGF